LRALARHYHSAGYSRSAESDHKVVAFVPAGE
jgi:hypothetical protein